MFSIEMLILSVKVYISCGFFCSYKMSFSSNGDGKRKIWLRFFSSWWNFHFKFGKIISRFTLTKRWEAALVTTILFPVSISLFNLFSSNTPCYHILQENGTDKKRNWSGLSLLNSALNIMDQKNNIKKSPKKREFVVASAFRS